MSFVFKENSYYSMPIYFGASTVQQDLNGNQSLFQPADLEMAAISFEVNREPLEEILPEGFTLIEPIMTLQFCQLTNIGWLAGNGYNLLNMIIPVKFDGEEDHIEGDFVLAMLENHADPIIAGRDAMGYNKIFSNMPNLKRYENTLTATASSWDFEFLKITLNLDEDPSDLKKMQELSERSQGALNIKFIPGTGNNFDEPDVNYPVFNPKVWNKPEDYKWELKVPNVNMCSGTVQFNMPEWKDMPTYYPLGKFLAGLEIKKYLGAQHVICSNPCDYSHCKKLK